jgi:hypothetical protein
LQRRHYLSVNIGNISYGMCGYMFYPTLHQIPYAQLKAALVLAIHTKRKEIFRATLTSLIRILQNYPYSKFKVQDINISPTNMFAI